MKTTQKRFWEVLESMRGKFKIERSTGRIRTKKTNQCPIVAVAKALLDKKDFVFEPVDNEYAAECVGLSVEFSKAIANAADCDDFYRGVPMKKWWPLRKKLIETLGLKEQERLVETIVSELKERESVAYW